MTAPLNLAALKALHEAATKHYGSQNIAFNEAAYASFPRLLAMLDTYHRLCEHVRTAACGPNHSMGDRFEEVDALKARAEKAEAEKAAMAERLAIATKALTAIDKYGDTRDSEIFSRDDTRSRRALAAIAAHEAERGKE